MEFAGIADQLLERYPQAREALEQIKRFDVAAASLPWQPFFEPVSVIERDVKGRGKYVNLDASRLQAWAKHMTYSMRVRMRNFEPTILRELLNGSSLVASTALRAHLEAAAMASLCVETLTESRTTASLEQLSALIPQTLFGTSLGRKASRDDRVQEMLTFAEQQTINICTAIDAFDSFAYGDAANGSTAILYSFLCEFAHPNHRGTTPFVSSKDVKPEGWEIAYSPDEQIPLETVVGIADGLRLSMRGGYAATEMLRVAEFLDDQHPYHGVPFPEFQRIWSAFLSSDA